MKRTLIVCFAIGVMTYLSIRLLPFACDDAYIHFRIAENFAQHGAPYFNCEQNVMATSSPVWTCAVTLLTLLAQLTHSSLPLLVALINGCLTVFGAIIWSRILQKTINRGPSKTTLWLFRFVYVGILLPSSVALMETPLAMLLVGWACLLLIDTKPFAFAVIALAIFTRYELIVFACLAAVLQLTTARGHILRSTLFFLLPFTIFIVALLYFFQTIIPQTTIAKQVVYSLPREIVFQNIFYKLVPRLNYPILGIQNAWRAQAFLSSFISWALIPGAALLAGLTLSSVPFSVMFKNRGGRHIVCIGITGVLIALAYVFNHVFLFAWYTPLFCVPILFFVFAVSHTSKLATLFALGLAVLPLSNVVAYSKAGMGYTHGFINAPWGARVQRYIEVGGILNRLFPDARLMTSEIGGLGISFRGVILDGAGLITPSALKHHPIEGQNPEFSFGGAIPIGFVREMNPELIVSYPMFLQESAWENITNQYLCLNIPAFSDEHSKRIGTNRLLAYDTLRIYVRLDVAKDEKIRILTHALKAKRLIHNIQ